MEGLIMFDLTDKDALMNLIDSRDRNCYVIPIYIHMDHQLYGLWEMDQIEHFNPHTIKVGFGSSKQLLAHNGFPNEWIERFNLVSNWSHYNYDLDVDIRYFVFETSGLLQEEIDQDDRLLQIEMYVDAICEKVSGIVDKKKQELRRRMLEDPDNYLSIISD
jgi:hypothetical protein